VAVIPALAGKGDEIGCVALTLHSRTAESQRICYPPRKLSEGVKEARRWLRDGYWSTSDGILALHAVTHVEFEVDPEDTPKEFRERG
jgi:hypothetical protein